jgi:hypothetical protein
MSREKYVRMAEEEDAEEIDYTCAYGHGCRKALCSRLVVGIGKVDGECTVFKSRRLGKKFQPMNELHLQ